MKKGQKGNVEMIKEQCQLLKERHQDLGDEYRHKIDIYLERCIKDRKRDYNLSRHCTRTQEILRFREQQGIQYWEKVATRERRLKERAADRHRERMWEWAHG